jgi:hypothetical protein
MVPKRLSCACIILNILSTAWAVSPDELLRERVSAAIRWQAFWEGPEALGPHYKAGRQIEARVLRIQNHLYTFLAPIRLTIDFTVSVPDLQIKSVGISVPAQKTNAEAITFFLQMRAAYGTGCLGQVLGDKAAPTRTITTNRIPPARPCLQQEDILSDESFTFSLPELKPPDSIQNRSLPSDNDGFVTEVRQFLESHREDCESTTITATIPYYSDTDPRVYVLLQSGGKCERGIASFSRAPNGRWEFGKFTLDVPRQQLARIISQIESNTALTLGP